MTSYAEAAPDGERPLEDLTFDPSQPLAVIGHKEIGGRQTLIYDTNNLSELYSAFIRVEGLEQGMGPGLYDYVILQNAFGSKDILTKHAQDFPDRLSEIIAYNQYRLEAKKSGGSSISFLGGAVVLAPTPEQEWAKKVLFSETYKELEPLVEEVKPGQNPRELCL